MKLDRDLWRANWGNTAFFFVATLVQINLALFAQKVFHLKPTEQAWLQAALSLGIGAGCLVAGRLSRGRVEYALIPLVQGAASWLSWVGIAAAAITQSQVSGNGYLSYGQIFWVCGAVACFTGVFVTWTRPTAVPEMFAR